MVGSRGLVWCNCTLFSRLDILGPSGIDFPMSALARLFLFRIIWKEAKPRNIRFLLGHRSKIEGTVNPG